MYSARVSSNLILDKCIFVHLHAKFAIVIEAMYIQCRRRKFKDEVAEWLRRQTANLIGSAFVSSNLILDDCIFVHLHAKFAMVIEAMYIYSMQKKKIKRRGGRVVKVSDC